MGKPINKQDGMDKEVVAMFARLSADEATDADLRALADWAEVAPEKLDELELLSDVWEQAGSLDVDQSLFLEEDAAQGFDWRGAIADFFREHWIRPAGMVAAAALVMVAVSLSVFQAPITERQSYATVRGAMKTVSLTDGSTVHINGLSRLEVNFGETERRIDLLEGEAYFEVSPDTERPFVVSVSGAEVRALGTAFDIDTGTEALTVIVTEGVVGVTVADIYSRFEAGTKVRIPWDAEAASDFTITKLILPNLEKAITWRDGVLTFTGEPLSVALERINRQSTKRIVLGDQSLASLQIFGSFSHDNLGSFLDALQTLYQIRVVEIDHRITLYVRRPDSENPANEKT